MTREAPRTHTDPAGIARLEALIAALPNGARVALALEGGEVAAGTVAARPILQVFHGPSGTEGSNAVLRLDVPPAPEAPNGVRDLWLDTVIDVRDLGPG